MPQPNNLTKRGAIEHELAVAEAALSSATQTMCMQEDQLKLCLSQLRHALAALAGALDTLASAANKAGDLATACEAAHNHVTYEMRELAREAE